MAESLHQLVDACLAGDSSATARFVDIYTRRVFGLCWRMLRHRQDAEDAAQETFVRALRSLARWDRSRPLEPWLLAIAGNRCRSMLARRVKRPAGLPLIDDDLEFDHDAIQAARHLGEEVRRALQRIRTSYAEAFRLFHEHELSYAEIATALDVPLGTVKTWVHRARREIVDELIKREVIEPPRPAVPKDASTNQRAAG